MAVLGSMALAWKVTIILAPLRLNCPMTMPVIPGSIQVPSDGLPIVLMADGQVTGGYVKIAHVISADMPLLAQAMPGEYLSFEAVALDAAYQLLEQREELLVWLRSNPANSASLR